MKVLVVNAGSSSLKFTMYRMTGEKVLAKGLVERIGMDGPRLKFETHEGNKIELKALVTNHDEALALICKKLVDPECGVIKSLSEVEAIGHRVVHGGEKFTESVLVDGSVKDIIRECFSLAPLHNPPNLGGIEACEHTFVGTPNVAVFDTAFHQTMPASSYLYAIPHELYEKKGIRKYGFHGTSHKFVTQAMAEYLGKPVEKLKLISCHLGNGGSVAAVDGGKVLDTTMGMTPLAGLVMGTRCGDIDPGVVIYMLQSGMSVKEVDEMLNKKSGLFGVAGIGSSDMRDMLEAADEGLGHAKQAVDMFVHRLISFIGAYYTALGGVDAIALTGGIGENSIPIRAKTVAKLAVFGCKLDEKANQKQGEAVTITTPDSPLPIVVMPTDEELMIARETKALAGK